MQTGYSSRPDNIDKNMMFSLFTLNALVLVVLVHNCFDEKWSANVFYVQYYKQKTISDTLKSYHALIHSLELTRNETVIH